MNGKIKNDICRNEENLRKEKKERKHCCFCPIKHTTCRHGNVRRRFYAFYHYGNSAFKQVTSAKDVKGEKKGDKGRLMDWTYDLKLKIKASIIVKDILFQIILNFSMCRAVIMDNYKIFLSKNYNNNK